MGVDAYLTAEIKIPGQTAFILRLNDGDYLLDDFLRNLSIPGKDRKSISVKPYLTQEEINFFEFTCIKEHNEGGVYTTDDVHAEKLFQVYDKIIGITEENSMAASVDEIMEITKWKLTRDTHPESIKSAISRNFSLVSALIAIKSIIEIVSRMNGTMKFIITYE